LNVLLVNYAHPRSPHVSGVRAWQFAKHLSALGHGVTLLAAPPKEPASPPSLDAGSSPRVLAADFREPSEAGVWAFAAARSARTAFNIAFRWGKWSAWVRSAEELLRRAPGGSRLDVVWGTFGNVESLHLACRVARSLQIPWVADVKDNLMYVPRSLRGWTAFRLRSLAALTCNSRLVSEQASGWLGRPAEVIYSGVDDAFFAPAGGREAGEETLIHLVGSLYRSDALRSFMRGVDLWADGLTASERARCVLRYSGQDTHLFSAAAEGLGIRHEASGYLPPSELARRCRAALVNAYVWLPMTFHHKLLELLSSRRPVLAFGGESEESRELARQVGGRLYPAADADAVAGFLRTLSGEARPGGEPPDGDRLFERFRWAHQARRLEEVLASVARRRAAS
jgi:hypothetical protein